MAAIEEFALESAIRVRNRGVALLINFAQLDGNTVISLFVTFSDWDDQEIISVNDVYPNGAFIQGDVVKLKGNRWEADYPWVVKTVYDDSVKVVDAKKQVLDVYKRRLKNLSYVTLPLADEPDNIVIRDSFNVFW